MQEGKGAKGVFESDRLLYRKPEAGDFDRFFAMVTDPLAKAWTGGVTQLTRAERFRRFEEDCANDLSSRGAEFAVIRKADGLYLGYCGFRQTALPGCMEFLYGYARDSWGKGYATEAARSVLRHLFTRYPHSRYIAFADPRNTASIRVLEKTGFVPAPGAAAPLGEPGEVYEIRRDRFKAQAL